jgi:thioredoxin 1
MKLLTASQFDEAIYDLGGPSLVIFFRKTCAVCKSVMPILESLALEYEGAMAFYHVDVEDDANLAKRFDLRGVPQILFFNNGEFQGRLAGMVDREVLSGKIDEITGGYKNER